MRYMRLELQQHLARTYVVGTLRGLARRRFEHLMQELPELRQHVLRWQDHLQPLADAAPPEAPDPSVWRAIEAEIGHAEPAGRPSRWGLRLLGPGFAVAALVAAQHVFEAFHGAPDELRHFRHVNTYGGHPVATAVGLRNLEILEREDLCARAARTGPKLLERLRRLADHPNVGDVRVKGVMCGIELVRSRSPWTPFEPSIGIGAQMCESSVARGLLIRPLGNVVTLNPAPAMDEQTHERMLDIFIDVLSSFEFPSD